MQPQNLTDPVRLLQDLIQCPSVTPAEGGALSLLQSWLEVLGFSVDRPVFQDKDTPDIENLYARVGNQGKHLMFAGHTDVVPSGDEQQWTYPPFAAQIDNQIVYGRGAVDMKGGIACFIAAFARLQTTQEFKNSVSLLITGDEEGPAINGTTKLLQWAAQKGEKWDGALVGEPTNPDHLGDMIKIGRRGSLSATVLVSGQQGHVAYPHHAANPLPLLAILVHELSTLTLDHGNDDFQPSNLEVISIDTDNHSSNVIPAAATFNFNIRFNTQWSIETLKAHIEKILQQTYQSYIKSIQADNHLSYSIDWTRNPSEVFLTQSSDLIAPLSKAIKHITRRDAQLSTSGGTSDARFIKNYCPVVEFGLVGQSMHKIDEHVPIEDLETLTQIYMAFMIDFFK